MLVCREVKGELKNACFSDRHAFPQVYKKNLPKRFVCKHIGNCITCKRELTSNSFLKIFIFLRTTEPDKKWQYTFFGTFSRDTVL